MRESPSKLQTQPITTTLLGRLSSSTKRNTSDSCLTVRWMSGNTWDAEIEESELDYPREFPRFPDFPHWIEDCLCDCKSVVNCFLSISVATYGLEAIELSDGAKRAIIQFNTSCVKKIRRNRDNFYVLKAEDPNLIDQIADRRDKWERQGHAALAPPISYELWNK